MNVGRRAARGRAAEGLPARLPFRRYSSRRLGRAGVPRHALRAVRRREPAARDRLLQRREHAAGARDDSRREFDDPRCDQRQPRPHRAAVARRECVLACGGLAPDACWRTAASSRSPATCRGRACRGRPRSGWIGLCSCSRSPPQRGDDWASACSLRCRARGGTRPRRQHDGALDGGRRQTRMRAGLVVAQVALSMVLLLGAGLLMRTFVKLVERTWESIRRTCWSPASGSRRANSVPRGQLQFYRSAVEGSGPCRVSRPLP